MNRDKIYTFILYFLGFLLLWEWLRPLEQITETGKIHYFVIFVVLSLLLNYFRWPFYISFCLKGIYVLYALYAIFANDHLSIWMSEWAKDVLSNATMLFTGDWYNLSPSFRSLLFFILLWQITYLMRYWLTVRNRIVVFYIMTVIYVTLLDTFTDYSGEQTIVRIVIIGFTLLGLLHYCRIFKQENLKEQPGMVWEWLVPLAAMIVLSISIGYLSPKAAPIWKDPVPFLKEKFSPNQEHSVATIGYGTDDTRLGGPFEGDNQLVFEVSAPTRQYWKIETKDIYTGKGWVHSEENQAASEFHSGEEFPLDIITKPEDPLAEATFNIHLTYPHIVRPYGFLSVAGLDNGKFQYDESLGKITAHTNNNEEVHLDEYTINFRQATYNIKEMRETKRLPAGENYDYIQSKYTQLPETLPNRVRLLAKELTEEYDNWFDQAKAIERHFQSGEFYYDQKNVATPADDQDYVDQFLFDTKRGYCDNFSTSMVTLLRAANIPARWAKGYTAGRFTGKVEGENRVYEVTNDNAHSWVEVFFPAIGWVPFEPTKGFDNYSSYSTGDEQSDNEITASVQEPTEPKTSEFSNESDLEASKEQEVDNSSAFAFPSFDLLQDKRAFIYAGIALSILAAALLIYWKRSTWIPFFLLLHFRKKDEENTFTQAYEALLKQLERCGMKREAGMTLRDYAAYVDEKFGSDEMTTLTMGFEKQIYYKENNETNWDEFKDVWVNVIKKTVS